MVSVVSRDEKYFLCRFMEKFLCVLFASYEENLYFLQKTQTKESYHEK